jgi:Zn-dependent protease
LLLSGNFSIEVLIANMLALLVGMTLHEFAHNFVGWKMGDPEPQRQGRLTLNPLVHINWIGWIMFALLGFGILGSAPISPYRMPRENRRWRWLAAVAAGPLANLAIVVVTAMILNIIGVNTIFSMGTLVGAIFSQMLILNAVLFFFNLIPLFPLDGWQIVYSLLPPQYAFTWEKYQQTTYYIFFGLLLLSFVRIPGIPNIFSILVSQPANALVNLLIF